jgi:probable F420-dependent oxidoreductase
MKVGIKIGPAMGTDVREAAQAAEGMGFDSVWLSERVVIPLDKPHPHEPMVDPWIALSYVAAVTERVTLGTSVSQIALRPPVLMARELATLDRLSGGRLIVGAGAGWVVEEFISTGIPFDDRGGRLNEYLRILKHLFTTPDQPWHGKYYDVPAVGIVQPTRPGGPPLFVGGFTDAGYRRAARYADGFIAGNTQQPEQFMRVRARIEELRAKYGRTGAFAYFAQASPPATPEAAREHAASLAAAGVECAILSYPGDVVAAMNEHRDALRAFIETSEAA